MLHWKWSPVLFIISFSPFVLLTIFELTIKEFKIVCMKDMNKIGSSLSMSQYIPFRPGSLRTYPAERGS